MNSPVVVSSGYMTIGQNAMVEANSQQMQNPFKTAMLVDEIRFAAPAVTITGPTVSSIDPILILEAEIRLGREPLTRDYVPFGCFGKVVKTSDTTDTRRFTWRLPKPLYLEPNELLVTKVRFRANGFPGAVGMGASTTFQVTYAGRALGSEFPIPKKRNLPFVAHFNIPELGATNGATQQTVSNQTQLVNPFREPLVLQRFIGRTSRYGTSSAGTAELGKYWCDTLPGRGTDVRAVDSFGNILVRDPTPFVHLFNFPERIWPVNGAILSPKGYYIFTVDQLYAITPPTAYSAYLSHAISFVGHREVEF